MVEEIGVFEGNKMKFTFKGTFNLEGIYKMCYWWLIDNGFESKHGDGNIEDYYLNIHIANTDLQNHWIWWRTQNSYDKLKVELHLDFQTLAVGNREIMHNGQKLKVQNGEITFHFFIKVTHDPGKWEETSFMKSIYKRVKKNHHAKIISDLKKDIYEDVFEFYDRIKMAVGAFETFPIDRPFDERDAMPQLTR